jgi:hypothetical protein
MIRMSLAARLVATIVAAMLIPALCIQAPPHVLAQESGKGPVLSKTRRASHTAQPLDPAQKLPEEAMPETVLPSYVSGEIYENAPETYVSPPRGWYGYEAHCYGPRVCRPQCCDPTWCKSQCCKPKCWGICDAYHHLAGQLIHGVQDPCRAMDPECCQARKYRGGLAGLLAKIKGSGRGSCNGCGCGCSSCGGDDELVSDDDTLRSTLVDYPVHPLARQPMAALIHKQRVLVAAPDSRGGTSAARKTSPAPRSSRAPRSAGQDQRGT